MSGLKFEEGGSQYSKPFNFEGKGKFRETEPMLLLDTTGSMKDSTSLGGSITRHKMAHDVLSAVVQALTAMDSAGESEEGGGGIKTTSFAGGKATDLGDLNLGNLEEEWSKLRWDGTTAIMPGWKLMLGNFYREFGKKARDEQPLQLITIITDGEAEDIEEFTKVLAKEEDAYVSIVLLGYLNPQNKDDPHPRLLNMFQTLAKNNTRVRLLDFTGSTDHTQIAAAIMERATQTR
jgi:hypothetical protein